LETSDRDLYIIGIPIILTLALVLLPANVTKNAPQILQYLLGLWRATLPLGGLAAVQYSPKFKKSYRVVSNLPLGGLAVVQYSPKFEKSYRVVRNLSQPQISPCLTLLVPHASCLNFA